MTTKSNQDMYTKIRAKKNEPLSALGNRVVRVVDQENPVVPTTIGTRPMRVGSLATSMEEIKPHSKKAHITDKGKEKASSRSSSVWENIDLAQTRIHEVFTNNELKAFSRVSPNEIMGCHVHKLV